MNGEMHSESDPLHRLAYDIASREGPRPKTTESTAPEDRQLCEELVEVEILLEALSDRLFGPSADGVPQRGAQGSAATAGLVGSALSIHALLTAAMLLLTIVGLWQVRTSPVTQPADRWRSPGSRPVDVTATIRGRSLALSWQEATVLRWYRVSIVAESGEVIARRDLEGGCECRIEVVLTEPPPAVYWLVEGFDATWDRSAVASGRIEIPGATEGAR